MKRVLGRYNVDQNFILICADGVLYTIVRKTGKWGCIDMLAYPYLANGYWRILSECTGIGLFEFGRIGHLIERYGERRYEAE